MSQIAIINLLFPTTKPYPLNTKCVRTENVHIIVNRYILFNNHNYYETLPQIMPYVKSVLSQILILTVFIGIKSICPRLVLVQGYKVQNAVSNRCPMHAIDYLLCNIKIFEIVNL